MTVRGDALPTAAQKIGILGWGSLIWDIRPEFDELHGDWQFEGPRLPLEFSRISAKSRKGALTLVIDRVHGASCTVAYALSKRRHYLDCLTDLQIREGAPRSRIGFWCSDGNRKCEVDVPQEIVTWAKSLGLDAVVWTGLPTNFEKETGREFTIEEALSYLLSLSREGKEMAAEYIRRAPDFVVTPVRSAIETTNWYKEIVASPGK